MFNFEMWVSGNNYNLCDDVFSEKVDCANFHNDVYVQMMDFIMEEDVKLSCSDFRYDIDYKINAVDEDTAENILHNIEMLKEEIQGTFETYDAINTRIDSWYGNTCTAEWYDKEFCIIERRYKNLSAFVDSIYDYYWKVNHYFIEKFNW